ncbi:TonB-dependent siderophore receptor [Chryseobacterium indologenes]|uniref:TonB-dependent siderophore receptor n=1 Tax=Chryseobacterium indologenes TaxID=253 RepID=UPI0016280098|nr:TonB-dependent receptor [Chryseobacterium indologenes]
MKKLLCSIPLLSGVLIVAQHKKDTTVQSKHIEEIIVSGVKKYAEKKSEYVAKMPLKNLENPQVYTVLPKELIQQQVATDLQSSLNLLPGVNNVSVSVGSGGVGLGLTMRGFSSNASAGALRNGMATNFVSLSDPVNLEAIEVIKGPSGTLFGSALLVGYGGFVNRVTKKPLHHFKGEIGYTAGSWSSNRVTVDVSTPLNKNKTFLARINAAYNNDGSFQDFGKSKSVAIAPSFSFKVNERLDINLDFEYFDISRNTTYMGLITGKDIVFKDKSINDFNLDKKISYASDEIQSKAKIFNTFATANYKISDNWVSQTSFSSAKTENDAHYLFLNLSNKGTIRRDYYHIPSTFNLNEIQQNFIGNFNISEKIKNKILVGFDYTTTKTTDKRGVVQDIDQQIYKNKFGNLDKFVPVMFNDESSPYISQAAYQDILGRTNYRGYKRDYRNFSVYVSDVINVSDRLFAMASLRYDHFNSVSDKDIQNSWSPKLGLVYQVIKDKVSLFGNYMNGFKNIAPSSSLGEIRTYKPEQANQWEGGVKYELLDGKLSGTLSYYNIQVKDKVRSTPTEKDPTLTIQDGTQRSQGVEMDLITSPFHGFNIILGYGYNDSVYEKAKADVQGRRPAGQARHAGNFWLSYTIPSGKYSGFGIGAGGNAQSQFYLVDSSDVVSKGYAKFDASVFYDQSSYRIALKLNNFTNQQYYLGDSWTYVQNPRQLLLSLNYKF